MQNISETQPSSPPKHYILRCGSQSNLVRIPAGTRELNRGTELLIRTERGLEMAVVLADSPNELSQEDSLASFVRLAGPEDQLLWNQLSALSLDAANRCQDFLNARQLPDVLVEVEPLMDGRTLYFHFLGDPTHETESYVQELAAVYQESVSTSQFAQLLETGCGPGCGTVEKSGCGTGGGCAVCAITGSCQSKKKQKGV